MKNRNVLFNGISILAIILLGGPCSILAQGQSGNILAPNAEFTFRAQIQNSECKPLIATNETPSILTIEKIYFAQESPYFVLTDIVPLPMKLSPKESVSLGYACFRPKISLKDYFSTISVAYSPMEKPGDALINLHATSYDAPVVPNVPPTSPGAIIKFDPATIKDGQLLSMIGNDEEFFRSFKFKNVSSKTITVNSIDFEKKNSRFELSTVEPDGSLPLDVAPGETFLVRISYHSIDRTPCFDKLLIHTDEPDIAVSYAIRGLQLPLSQLDWNKKQNSQSGNQNTESEVRSK